MSPDKYRHTPRERAALLRQLDLALKANNEQEFMQILRKQGVKDEDPRFGVLLKLFRDLRSGKT